MGPGYPTPLLLASGGHHWRLIQTCSLDVLPLPHKNTYGWQVGGTHPAGMLSCFIDLSLTKNSICERMDIW